MRAKERRKLILERLQQEKRVMLPDLEDIAIKEALLERSYTKILVADHAKRTNLTVLTASLDAAEILSQEKGNRLIIVPGVYYPALRGASGQMTADFMERFHIDWLFLGANGLDADYGLTSPDDSDAETKRVLIRQARRTVVATDSTKLGQSYFERIARLEEITRVVTDNKAAPELLETMRQRTDVDSVG